MNRTKLAALGTWIACTAFCLAQQAPPVAVPPAPVEPRPVPIVPAKPGPAKGLTDGTGLTPLAVAAPVGVIPDPHKGSRNPHCYNHSFCKFFTYCPVLGGCCKGCSCCCPPTYTFFFCTPVPTTRINTPFYIAMWPSTPVPLPMRTPLTPDPVPQPPAGGVTPIPH